MPYLEQMNYQGNRFFCAEGRISGRDTPVKEKTTADGMIAVAFTLNVGYTRMFDPNGKHEDESGQKWTHDMHNLYCKIYPSRDNANAWQIEEARSLRYREHVVVFGKIYTAKLPDDDGEEIPYTEYRVDSILFPERLASLQANGNADLSRIHTYEYTPPDAMNSKEKPSGAKKTIEETGDEWF